MLKQTPLNACASLIFVIAIFLTGHSPHQQQAQAFDNLAAMTSEALSILVQAEAAAANIKSAYQRGFALDQIGAAEARAGDLDAAVESARRAYPNDMATLKAIGEQLANLKDSGKAETIKAKLQRGQSSTVFAFMAGRQAEKGNIDEALRRTEQIEVPEVRSDALIRIAQQQAATGDYSGARKTFARARIVHPADRSTPDDVEMMIAKGQLSRGDTAAAHTTVSSMKSAEMRSMVLISGAEILLEKADKINAAAWLEEAIRGLPAGARADFERYLAIPLQVKLGQKDRAMQSAGAWSPDARLKGYGAVAVTCAEGKDIVGVDSALERMQVAASSAGEDRELSGFEAKLMILNVTAALLDNGEFETSSRLLKSVEQQLDEVSKSSIEPDIQLRHVFALAQQGKFDDARSLAKKMRANSTPIAERGTAWRTIAQLQTRKNGVASAHPWVLALADSEDRAYALLGIAQALLEIDDAKLPYNAIQIH